MSFGRWFVDVTSDPRLSALIVPGSVDRRVPLARPTGRSNVDVLRAAIQLLSPAYLNIAVLNPAGFATLRGGILYFPPGRYLIENTPPDEWRDNLWSLHLRGQYTNTLWAYDRAQNPFGACLRIPDDVTLWLAPGAVLVPERDAIIHIEGPLNCEPAPAFDISRGGLVVFGTKTPKLIPQWWGIYPGEDHADAVQAAIDAGIHNRSNIWEYPFINNDRSVTYAFAQKDLPPIPVELRGTYHLRKTISVRGFSIQNEILKILDRRTVELPSTYSQPRHVYLKSSDRQGVLVPSSLTDDVDPIISYTVQPAGSLNVVYEFANLFVRISTSSDPTSVTAMTLTLTLRPGPKGEERTVVVGVSVVDPLLAQRDVRPINPNTVIAGAWSGRKGRGARLVAEAPFAGDFLLELVAPHGLTVRNVDFDGGAVPHLGCVFFRQPVPYAPFQGPAVRDCTFAGRDATLVQVGPPLKGVNSGSTRDGTQPSALPTNYGVDMSGLAFDGCDFHPQDAAIGLMVRTQETFHLRVRHCDFVGVARAMISFWEGNLLVDGCRFDNSPLSAPLLHAPVVGFEEPDGSDIYLNNEPLQRIGNAQPVRVFGALGGFTVTGCSSHSPRFLSSASPYNGNVQQQARPVTLLNVRHLPTDDARDGVSVSWGRMAVTSATLIERVDARERTRLGRGAPLVILGGQYRGAYRVLLGAVQSVIVGARDAGDGLMPIELTEATAAVRRPTPETDVFGLSIDRIAWDRVST